MWPLHTYHRITPRILKMSIRLCVESLEKQIHLYSQQGNLIILGDLNARTSQNVDHVWGWGGGVNQGYSSHIPDFVGLYSLIPDHLSLYSLIPDFWGPLFRYSRFQTSCPRSHIFPTNYYLLSFPYDRNKYINAYPPPPSILALW